MFAAVGIADTAADHSHLSLASPQPATAPANAEPAVHDASSVAPRAFLRCDSAPSILNPGSSACLIHVLVAHVGAPTDKVSRKSRTFDQPVVIEHAPRVDVGRCGGSIR